MQTSRADGSARLVDDLLLRRAAELGRVLVTHDKGFLTLTYVLYAQGVECPGVIYAEQDYPLGALIEELHLIAEAMRPEELANRCTPLPI